MYIKYNDSTDALSYIKERLSKYPGSSEFADCLKYTTNKDGKDLVGLATTLVKYHRHDDLKIDSLLKSSAHFKNLAYSYLDEGRYDMFRLWIVNWSYMKGVCKMIGG